MRMLLRRHVLRMFIRLQMLRHKSVVLPKYPSLVRGGSAIGYQSVIPKDRAKSTKSHSGVSLVLWFMSLQPSMKLAICCVHGMTMVKVFISQWSWDLHRDFLSGQAPN